MKKLASFLLFYLFCLALPGKTFAQLSGAPPQALPVDYRNAVFLEIGGNGLAGSLNYERLFALTGDPMVALRIGAFYWPDFYSHLVAVPAEVSIINGKRPVKFEFGFGLTYLQTISRERPYDGVFVEEQKALIPVFRLGVRYQVPGKPLLLRAGFTPFMFTDKSRSRDEQIIRPWGGISVGYRFGK